MRYALAVAMFFVGITMAHAIDSGDNFNFDSVTDRGVLIEALETLEGSLDASVVDREGMRLDISITIDLLENMRALTSIEAALIKTNLKCFQEKFGQNDIFESAFRALESTSQRFVCVVPKAKSQKAG